MSVSFSVGSGDPFALDQLSDLQHVAQTVLKLGTEFESFLSMPVSALPANLSSTSVQYVSGNQTWTPGPITFTLSGAVAGHLAVLTSGDLLSYTASFPTQVTLGASPAPNAEATQTIAVPAGVNYIVLELDFTLSGGLAGSYTSGVYGVSTDNAAASGLS